MQIRCRCCNYYYWCRNIQRTSMFCIWMTQDGVFVSHENDEAVSNPLVTMADVKQILLEINILNSPNFQDCTQKECESPLLTCVIPLLKVDKYDCSSYFTLVSLTAATNKITAVMWDSVGMYFMPGNMGCGNNKRFVTSFWWKYA